MKTLIKSVKRILAAALVLLGAALLAIIFSYLWVDDTTLVSQMVKRLESSSDIRILHRGDAHITRTLAPILTLDDLIIADTGRQFRVETASLAVQISLPKLLLGQLDIPRLLIGATRIEIEQDQSPEKPAAAPLLKPGLTRSALPLTPVLHDIRISKLEIMHNGGEVPMPGSHLSGLILKLNTDNSMDLSGQLKLADQNIDVNAVLRDVNEYFGRQPLAFSLGMQRAPFKLSVEGHIDFGQPVATIEAVARGWTPDAAKMGTGIQDIEIPGKLTLEAQLKGTFAQLALEQITASWHGPDHSGAELKGRIANVIGLDGVQLNLAGKLDNPAWLTPVLPESIGALKSAGSSAQISGAYPMFDVSNFDFHGKTEHDLDVSLSGRFDLAHSSIGLHPANFHLDLAFAAPKTRAARALLFETIPEFGAITGRGDIRSAVGDPSIKNITVQIKDTNGIQVSLSGAIAKLPLSDQPSSGYDMDVSMKAGKAADMAARVGIKLPALGPLNLNFRIEGSSQALQLNKIKLSAGRQDAVRIGVQGQLAFGDWDQADPFEKIDLKLQAQSHTTRALGTLIDQKLPELGNLSAKARLHTVSGRHRLDQLHIQTAGAAALSAAVSGSVAHVSLLPELRFAKIKLDAQASSGDTAQLNTVLGLKDEIPPIGPLKVQTRISGDDRNLDIGNFFMEAGQKDLLLVKLSGLLCKLSASNQWQPQNTALFMQASSRSSRALAETLGFSLPDLGPLSARANIYAKNKKFSLDSAQLRLGDMDNPVVEAAGYIHDLPAMKGVKWDAQLHLDARRLGAFAGFPKLAELGAVTGRLSISDSDGILGIDSLHAETEQSKLLGLKMDGSFDNFKDPSTLILESSLTARDLQLIGAIFDLAWPAIGPVQLDSQIKNSDHGQEFKSTLTAGQTELQTTLKAVFNTTPMRVNGTIEARKLFMPDLSEKAAEPGKEKPSNKEPVFSRTPIAVDWLKKVDADIAINVESFAQESSGADSAKFQVVLNSGVLSIGPAHLVYPKGKLDIDLQLDTRNHPRLRFSAFGQKLDPWRTMDIEGHEKEFEAEINVDMSLSTSGATPHELAANSQGSIYITLQNGKIRTAPIDLVFMDLAGWAWRKTTNDKYYVFDCGVADFSIEQGVVSTKAFILDTKDIAITGAGTIDLGREEVEYVLLPKKKTRFIHKADPVKIAGPLNDPSVKALPWKSAATTYGKYAGMIFLPYIFIPLTAADYLVGNLKSKAVKSPCLEYQKSHKMKK